jgi:hypothetical protein
MKQTIRQLMHRESEQLFNVDIYNDMELIGFLKDMDPENQEWTDGIDSMAHIQKMELLDHC